MPQMAPINWLSLFITFVISLIIFSTLNYFFVLYQPKKSSIKMKSNINNWSW
uniref:ATP synthase complex subunit 8 n=1 Tax=Physosmaragdina nigrifrons TaxID=1453301 RepID=A0A890CD66_9CUCU|nr:ATP synthase F0 subunit 8 [Physosmaragdina nigrifrons]QRG29980.1 ATP synthase F0 subunit 8 [Physosmaragdina nigrifrons]QUB07153.1 ATP synthase F0 subunit 8 [Physosmaragdina sp. N56]